MALAQKMLKYIMFNENLNIKTKGAGISWIYK